MKRITPFVIALAALAFLTSCSSLRVGYSFADWYLVSEIDDMFDLDSTQKQKVDELVDQLHHWHKTEEIPRIIVMLDQAADRMKPSLSQNDLNWLSKELVDMKIRTVNQVADEVSVLLTTLSDQQIDHLEQALAEQNEETEEKLSMPLDEWEEERRERTIETLNDWFGSLDEQQERELLAATDFDRTARRRHHVQTIAVQKRFVAFLRTKPSAAEIKSTLSSWIIAPDTYYSDEYREFRSQQRKKRAAFYLKLNRTITERQRQTAIDKLMSYRSDLDIIHTSS